MTRSNHLTLLALVMIVTSTAGCPNDNPGPNTPEEDSGANRGTETGEKPEPKT